MTLATAGTRTLYRALDHCFEVAGAPPELSDRIAAVFADLAVAADAVPDRVVRYEVLEGSSPERLRLRCDDEPVFGETTPSHLLSTLIWHVNAQATQHLAMPGHVVLHASAAVKGGRAVVLAAPMESGKTTTVAGLLQAGFGYLTDEAAAVCVDDLQVEPFHKSLAVDHGSWPVLPRLRDLDVGGLSHQWQVPASSIPGASLARRAPVELVLLPRYEAGGPTELLPVSRAEAVMALSASTFQFLDAPQRNIDGLAAMTLVSRCFRLRIGDLDEAVELVDGLMTP